MAYNRSKNSSMEVFLWWLSLQAQAGQMCRENGATSPSPVETNKRASNKPFMLYPFASGSIQLQLSF